MIGFFSAIIEERMSLKNVSIRIAFLLMFHFSQVGVAETRFLLEPTRSEFSALSHVFSQSGIPLPVPVLFNPLDSKEVTWGIPDSITIRRGVHTRLAVAKGYIKHLLEVKNLPNLRAGTLFLETQEEKPVLSFHFHNSKRSSSFSSYFAPSFHTLQNLANKLGLPIVNPTQELFDTINQITLESKKQGSESRLEIYLREYNKGFKREFILQPYVPANLPPDEKPLRTELISSIKKTWGVPDCNLHLLSR